jgi:hypothetical protein
LPMGELAKTFVQRIKLQSMPPHGLCRGNGAGECFRCTAIWNDAHKRPWWAGRPNFFFGLDKAGC